MAIDPSIIASILKSLTDDPGSVPLRLYLGSLYLVSADYAKADKAFAEVLAKDPVNARRAQRGGGERLLL